MPASSGSLRAPAAVINNSVLAIDHSDTFTLVGTISGTGQFNQIGTGNTILAANNTYTGNTTISAGTLQIGNGGTSGTISGNSNDNANLTFDRSDDATFNNVISGTGTVTKLGTNTLTIASDQTYTGTTTIAAGTLQLGSGGTPGTLGTAGAQQALAACHRQFRSRRQSHQCHNSGQHHFRHGAIQSTRFRHHRSHRRQYLHRTHDDLRRNTPTRKWRKMPPARSSATLPTTAFSPSIHSNWHLILSNLVSGTGQLEQLGTGTTMAITSDNTFTGPTTISAGTLQLGNAGATPGSLGTMHVINNSCSRRQPQRYLHARGHGLGHRPVQPKRRQHHHSYRQQHLHRRHYHLRRHAPAWQRWDQRLDCRRHY